LNTYKPLQAKKAHAEVQTAGLTDAAPVGATEEPTETPLEALSSMCTILAVGLFVMAFIFQNMQIPSGSMENTLLIGDHVVVDRITLAPPTKWAPFVHYRPVRRGDVIVFMKPHTEAPNLILVKRAIGVAGDRIHLRQGVVYLNGVAQSEPYAIMPKEGEFVSYRDNFPADIAGLSQEASQDLAARGSCEDQACINQEGIDNRTITWADELPSFVKGDDLVVPPGMVFAMGDNRTASLDGRFWGFVPTENILGRPLFVYWSFRTPADEEDKTSMRDKLGFMFHTATNFFSGTRWGRTLHVVR
jgi:signal peptidase I